MSSDRLTLTITVSLSPGKTGMFFASCESEPTFFVSATSLENLWAALPSALEYLYKSKYPPLPITGAVAAIAEKGDS